MTAPLADRATAWAGERLSRLYPEWQVLEPFLPASERDEHVLEHAVLGTVLHIPLSSSDAEAARQQLAWWMGGLAWLGSPDAGAEHGWDQHPGLLGLRASGWSERRSATAIRRWLGDLERCLDAPPPVDRAALWDALRSLVAPLAHGDDAVVREALATLYATRLLLQQLGGLADRNGLYRRLPMSLRARHRVRVDAGGPEVPTREAEPFEPPRALVDELLAMVPATADSAIGAGAPALWQAANRDLARRLMRRRSTARPPPPPGPRLALACWRAARRGRRL
jgi:hypothetical protein